MLRIAHIVKPMCAAPDSEHGIAQPITFASMRAARVAAGKEGIAVEQWATFLPEEEHVVPSDFLKTRPLDRTIGDLLCFRIPRPLPLLRDVLDRLYQASDAEYFIYTNVDIALQPHFYTAVRDHILQGYDAFTINRRTVTDAFRSVEDLPKLYAEHGTPHPGYDCFVFRRDAYPSFILGDVCLGCGHVDTPLICSMIANAKKFIDVTDAHLTLHLGDSRTWWKWKYRDYLLYNDRTAAKALLAQALRGGFLKNIWPHMRLFLALPLLKNSMIVKEWKRIVERKI